MCPAFTGPSARYASKRFLRPIVILAFVLRAPNGYVIRRAYRAGPVGIGAVWIDQLLHIIPVLFSEPLLGQLRRRSVLLNIIVQFV
jgi:hypothetical protein